MKSITRNHTIDILKLLFAWCVVGIHMTVFASHPAVCFTLTHGLFRIGVPFFFVVSGYFFAGKIHDKEASGRYLKSILKLYIVFEIIDIILNTLNHQGIWSQPLMILRKVFTCGVNGVYWYLISLFLTCLLLRPLWAKKKTNILIFVGLVLYILAMMDDTYAGFFMNTKIQELVQMRTQFWKWPQAGLAMSVLFLSIGVKLRQNAVEVKHTGLLFLVSCVLLILEANFTQTHGALDANCYFSLIFAAPLLVLLALKHPFLINCPKEVRDLSMYIYMVHIYINYALVFLYPKYLRWVVSCLISTLIAALIMWVKGRRKKERAAV
ncbi:MAG: acyltransferase [Solobacterium sp.]|nr:acyltransferase [Solobacterium sp.]